MSRVFLSCMYKSDLAGRVRSDVIRNDSYECAACVVVKNIKFNVVQGVNFNTENSKLIYMYVGCWKIAWFTEVC